MRIVRLKQDYNTELHRMFEVSGVVSRLQKSEANIRKRLASTALIRWFSLRVFTNDSVQDLQQCRRSKIDSLMRF